HPCRCGESAGIEESLAYADAPQFVHRFQLVGGLGISGSVQRALSCRHGKRPALERCEHAIHLPIAQNPSGHARTGKPFSFSSRQLIYEAELEDMWNVVTGDRAIPGE